MYITELFLIILFLIVAFHRPQLPHLNTHMFKLLLLLLVVVVTYLKGLYAGVLLSGIIIIMLHTTYEEGMETTSSSSKEENTKDLLELEQRKPKSSTHDADSANLDKQDETLSEDEPKPTVSSTKEEFSLYNI